MKTSIDFSYLKKLINELETEIKVSEVEIDPSLSKEAQELLENDRRVALNKASGLCMGISQEGTMLMYDIQKLVAASFGLMKSSKEDLAENALSGFLKSYKINDKN